MSVELIPHTEVEAARAQFNQYGHVGLTGLIKPDVLEPAVKEAYKLVARPRKRALGEMVGKFQHMPDPRKQENLHVVLEGIRESAVLLGRDITPSLDDETPQLELLDMMRGTKGNEHLDDEALADVVALTNLRGSSFFWFEEGNVNYLVNPGDIVLHDLSRRLLHRGTATDNGERIGLAVAKRKKEPSQSIAQR